MISLYFLCFNHWELRLSRLILFRRHDLVQENKKSVDETANRLIGMQGRQQALFGIGEEVIIFIKGKAEGEHGEKRIEKDDQRNGITHPGVGDIGLPGAEFFEKRGEVERESEAEKKVDGLMHGHGGKRLDEEKGNGEDRKKIWRQGDQRITGAKMRHLAAVMFGSDEMLNVSEK